PLHSDLSRRGASGNGLERSPVCKTPERYAERSTEFAKHVLEDNEGGELHDNVIAEIAPDARDHGIRDPRARTAARPLHWRGSNHLHARQKTVLMFSRRGASTPTFAKQSGVRGIRRACEHLK